MPGHSHTLSCVAHLDPARPHKPTILQGHKHKARVNVYVLVVDSIAVFGTSHHCCTHDCAAANTKTI